MNAEVYWRTSFLAMASAKQLTEYIVLDVEIAPGQEAKSKWALAEVQVSSGGGQEGRGEGGIGSFVFGQKGQPRVTGLLRGNEIT